MSPQVVAAVIAASVSFLTLIGTLAVQISSRRATSKQLDKTFDEQRTRTLNERFATAAEQLGSDKPPAVRLAGVYAMAGLADDWEKNRQTCVNVLCAYLRMPYEPDPGDPGDDAPGPGWLAFRASREVRHTIIRVITAHLKPGAVVPWQGLDLNFTGVVFDGGDFRHAVFSGGEVDFSHAVFSGGEVSFTGARFSGGTVRFTRAVFSGDPVDFTGAEFSDGTVSFTGARFSGMVRFVGAVFSGGRVDFGAVFSGEVRFAHARFSGATVSFAVARFSDCTVSFRQVKDWKCPPAFPWTGPPPPGVMLPGKEDQSQA